ncbi:MAG TPA: ATP-grasp domain-containing protein [Clostridiaceae bacterium]|nr:ATP-grasp domain-containing protein [Clostridiaceae bacterium]
MLHVGVLYTRSGTGEVDEKMDRETFEKENITAAAIEHALEKGGHRVTMIPATLNLLQDITENKDLDIVFNACTGIHSKSEQANVVAMLELTGIPFIGSGLSTHILGLHKEISKRLFTTYGIPTPKFQAFITGDEPVDPNLRYPLIVKPEHEGSSAGIDKASVVFEEDGLKERVRMIISQFQQPALVEEFIVGREFTIGVIGNDKPVVLPIQETVYTKDEEYGVMSDQMKSEDDLILVCPAKIDRETEEQMGEYAKKIYTALDCKDYARMDVRMDAEGRLYFIDINTLPGLRPNFSDFPNVATKGGYDYDGLINEILNLAVERSGKD